MVSVQPRSARAGSEYRSAAGVAEDARLALVDAIRADHEAGLSEAQIVQAAGVARDTVRKALRKGKG